MNRRGKGAQVGAAPMPRNDRLLYMTFRAHYLRLLLLGLIFSSSLLGTAGQLSNSTEKRVVAVIDALNQAGVHRDVERLKSLYSAQYFHTNPDGSVMTLADVLASYRKPTPFKFDSSSADERRVIVPADDVAIVNERLSLHGRKDGSPFVSHYRVTYVLVREVQGWKVINSHSSLLGI